MPKSGVKGQHYAHPISAFVTSEQAAAMVLDESVNRPGHVPGTFGKALDQFFAANPDVSRDPTGWAAAERETYEPQILANYRTDRNHTNMTDAASRATHIMGTGTTLSAAPGSFDRVPR